MSIAHILSSNNVTATGSALSQPPGLSITVPSIKSASNLNYSVVSTGTTAIAPAAASLPNGISYFSGSTSAATWTPPLPPAVYAFLVGQGITPIIGSSFWFIISNGNTSSGAVTPQAAAGVTYALASATVPIGVSRKCLFVFTAVGVSSTATIYA